MKTLCLEITNAYFSVIIIFCIAEEIHSKTWIIMVGSNKNICHAPNKGNGPFASIFRPVSVIASTLLTSMILLHEFFFKLCMHISATILNIGFPVHLIVR